MWLKHCPKLIYLTLFGNPISFDPNLRSLTINHIESLIAFNEHIISDSERLREYSFPHKYSAQSSRYKMPPPQYLPDTSPLDHLYATKVYL